jgi:hypothetical protein
MILESIKSLSLAVVASITAHVAVPIRKADTA